MKIQSLPKEPLSIINIILLTLKAYPKVVPRIWMFVALSSVGHLVIPWLYQINPAFAAVALFGFVLLTWFLYPIIMWLVEAEFEGGAHMPHSVAYQMARERYLSILGSNLVFFAIGLFVALVIYGLDLVFHLIGHHPFFFAISIALSLYIFIMLYFAIPCIVIEKNVVIGAFFRSIALVKNNWWRTFVPLALIGLAILGFEALGILFTGKARMFLFTGYNFILQMLFYPLIVTVTLVMLNDLVLRHQKRG
ncbi:MAG: hypothetical protein K0Q74_1012 [Gammaproteobacteria bacterium]|jgi:hypothetical protein|nr:hypothetical protein [Gammaproteobacteria bacterium]